MTAALRLLLRAARLPTPGMPCGVARGLLADLVRTKTQLLAENALLRQQLLVAARGIKKPNNAGWMSCPRVLEDGGQVSFKSPSALDAIDGFLKCTGHEFECAKIAGRKFESIGDHAGYLRDGGCAKVLDALAAR